MGSAAILLVSIVLLLNFQMGFCGCFKRIFSFGDSIIDTGNFVRMVCSTPIKELPYGMTYFNHPTGRVSDGHVILDFYGEYVHTMRDHEPTHLATRVPCINLVVGFIMYVHIHVYARITISASARPTTRSAEHTGAGNFVVP
jgi:hypothetical protein